VFSLARIVQILSQITLFHLVPLSFVMIRFSNILISMPGSPKCTLHFGLSGQNIYAIFIYPPSAMCHSDVTVFDWSNILMQGNSKLSNLIYEYYSIHPHHC
jgi:hypothetical protein